MRRHHYRNFPHTAFEFRQNKNVLNAAVEDEGTMQANSSISRYVGEMFQHVDVRSSSPAVCHLVGEKVEDDRGPEQLTQTVTRWSHLRSPIWRTKQQCGGADVA